MNSFTDKGLKSSLAHNLDLIYLYFLASVKEFISFINVVPAMASMGWWQTVHAFLSVDRAIKINRSTLKKA